MQVQEVAKRHGVSVQKILKLLAELGIDKRDPFSNLTPQDESRLESKLAEMLRQSTGNHGVVKVLRPSTRPGAVVRPRPVRAGSSQPTGNDQSADTTSPDQPSAPSKTPRRKPESPAREEGRRNDASDRARALLRKKARAQTSVDISKFVEPASEPEPEEPEVTQPTAEEPQPTEAEVAAPAPTGEGAAPAVEAQDKTDSKGSKSKDRSKPVSTAEEGSQQSTATAKDAQQPSDKQLEAAETSADGADQEVAGDPTLPVPDAVAPKPEDKSAGAPKKGKNNRRQKKEEYREQKQVREENQHKRKVLSTFASKTRGSKKRYKDKKRDRQAARDEAEQEREERERTTLRIHEASTVADVAHGLNISPAEIQKVLLELGKMVTINQHLDDECIEIIAEEYGFQVEHTTILDENLFAEYEEEDTPEMQEPRPPVVTVMGHVDHGKTKLMDAIRSADVASQESGGITQHIGAYFVRLGNNVSMCFLDTPGHEAFTAMRARGAMVTDVVVLVVAADDGVMPQTREAIHHAKAAEVPIIVAINKIDTPGANIDKVKQQLAAEELVPEEWGGNTPVAEISALKKIGIDELVELIQIQAEMLELKANPRKLAKGTVVEAQMEAGRGTIVTALVQDGTLHPGDSIVAGIYSGKIRALLNEHGKRLSSAGPGTPVALMGLSGTPVAGDEMRALPNERVARELSAKLQQLHREREIRRREHVSLANLFDRIEEGAVKELRLIVKGDVQGSVEAVCESLQSIESDKVRVGILHRGVGNVSESDVMLASASDAIVLGFHVTTPAEVENLREREGVDVRNYEIIYKAIEDIKKAMAGLLEDEIQEVVLGHLEVLQVFNPLKGGVVFGGTVRDGKMKKGAMIRIMRNNKQIHESKLNSLRRFKDEVKEVPVGLECGMGVQDFQDIQIHDEIECYQLQSVAPTL